MPSGQRMAYLDCSSGASGNMLLGALLDAGFPEDLLRNEVAKLGVTGFMLNISRSHKEGVAGTYVDVQVTEAQPERHLSEIESIITRSHLDAPIQRGALGVFSHLARAEAIAHGIAESEVHFHEVGAVDAIVDIVGVMAGFHFLGIDRVHVSPVKTGWGQARMAHGLTAIPAPATVELLKGMTTYPGAAEKELLTPTGAALLKTLGNEFYAEHGPPAMTVHKTGVGCGTWDLEEPNILRLWVGEPTR